MFENSTVLITGGTGSFGRAFTERILEKHSPKKVIIFSRDEMKQWEMAKLYEEDSRVRFFIGDVRDRDRVYRALDGVDFVVHAAATKIVPTAEYNPFEAVKTNVLGAMNLVDAALDRGVKNWWPCRRIKPAAQSTYTVQQSWFQTKSLPLQLLTRVLIKLFSQ